MLMLLKQRHRHILTARQNAIQVVHVDGNQFEIGTLLGDVIQAAFELAHDAIFSPAAFWENDQRLGFRVPSREHHFDRALMDLDFTSVDQHRV